MRVAVAPASTADVVADAMTAIACLSGRGVRVKDERVDQQRPMLGYHQVVESVDTETSCDGLMDTVVQSAAPFQGGRPS